MRTVGQYITHVSTQMNDQRPGRAFTRWGRGLLLEYLNLGLAEIGTYRPEAFAKDLEITLQAGATQSVQPGVTLLGLSANEDGTPINKGDAIMANAYNAYSVCKSGVVFVDGNPVYLVRSFSIDKNDSSKFYVDPPVPKGLTPKVVASVTGAPDNYTLANWDNDIFLASKYKANLIDYMMACAYGLDRESAESRIRSDSLYRRFYDVMGVKYRQESRHNSGYYLGKVGTGDPQAGAR